MGQAEREVYPVIRYNYLQQPTNDQRRIHIEQMIANLPPPKRKAPIASIGGDKIKQARR